MENLRLTTLERARIIDACTWVGITASFLPYLREYLVVRLADRPDLSAKVARLDERGTYHLWEWIKEQQLRPVLRGSSEHEVPATRTRRPLRPVV